MTSRGPQSAGPATASHPTLSYSDMLDTGEDEEDGSLDPRVKIELESLNQAAIDVNRLEKEIDLAREKYQVTFTESSQQLESLKKKLRDSIKKARPYYELKEAAKEAQSEALRSARKFQAANGVYLAAKETFSLAELRLMDDKAVTLSAAWQEMLNHALLKVMEAEEAKTKAEKEHLKRAANFAKMEFELHALEKKQKKSIAKARVYFETKKELEIKLQQLKQTLEDLQQAMRSSKRRYSMSLRHLESISDGIHEKRRRKLMLMLPREPGVGAEETEELDRARVSSLTSSSMTDDSRHLSELDDLSLTLQDEEIDDIDEEFLGYENIQIESVFRAKVLSTALDEDDTSFMNRGAFRERKKRLMRAQSLPMNIHQKSRTNAQFTFHTQNNSEENFGFGSRISGNESFSTVDDSLKSERSENSPPDGDSLNHESQSDCEERLGDIEGGVSKKSERFSLENSHNTDSSTSKYDPEDSSVAQTDSQDTSDFQISSEDKSDTHVDSEDKSLPHISSEETLDS